MELRDLKAGVTVEELIEQQAQFDFGLAIHLLRDGHKLARAGWNGKGMFVYLVSGSLVHELRGEAAKHVGQPSGKDAQVICPHIDMKAADGSIVVGWLASQTDLLAEDWIVIE